MTDPSDLPRAKWDLATIEVHSGTQLKDSIGQVIDLTVTRGNAVTATVGKLVAVEDTWVDAWIGSTRFIFEGAGEVVIDWSQQWTITKQQVFPSRYSVRVDGEWRTA